MFIIKSCTGQIAKAYAKANLPPPGIEPETSYMRIEKRWSEEDRRRILRADFFASRPEATRFPSESDAWAAFDQTGYCGREYYTVEPV